jgi:ubiquitin C-terminal hydrolase
MNELTIIEALGIIRKRAQWMRQEGESDIRSIIYLVDGLMTDITKGKSREEILSDFEEEEEEDEE